MPPTWTNRNKTITERFGDLDPTDIGNLTPTDDLPGTIPQITLGEATPNTAIYTIFANKTKSASPTYTNRSKSADPTYANRSQS